MTIRSGTPSSVGPAEALAGPDQVKAYYDAFSRDRMLNYRIRPNPRIERAIQFFRASIHPDDIVLDIGCGIGIATEAMARRARAVVGVDISEQNIWYAERTIRLPNIKFHRMDIVREVDALKSLLPSAPTAITMCDVIEHIPAEARPSLFQSIRRLSDDRAKLLLTFPSEFYQHYMAREARHELQIIDNVITPDVLVTEAGAAGFCMTYFQLVDIWKQVQYAHCRLDSSAELSRRVRERPPSSRRTAWHRLKDTVERALIERRRRKRYIDDVFASRR
jgi:cyclopropane fatty-acyl-phospholipid synthase-like methyltransferase